MNYCTVVAHFTTLYNEPARSAKRSNGVALAVALGWSVGQAGIGSCPNALLLLPLSGGEFCTASASASEAVAKMLQKKRKTYHKINAAKPLQQVQPKETYFSHQMCP